MRVLLAIKAHRKEHPGSLAKLFITTRVFLADRKLNYSIPPF
jgi:hypothetical protein